MRKAAALFVLLPLVLSPRLGAQVEGRTATPAELGLPETVEVKSPMLLEISLGASGEKRSFADAEVQGRTIYDTKKFVVDKARVPKVFIRKRPKGRTMELEVTPTITTTWYRQDIDVLVALIGPDGKEVARQLWDDLTVGDDNSVANRMGMAVAAPAQTRHPTATFKLPQADFDALFTGAKPPLIRLVLTIQGDEDE